MFLVALAPEALRFGPGSERGAACKKKMKLIISRRRRRLQGALINDRRGQASLYSTFAALVLIHYRHTPSFFGSSSNAVDVGSGPGFGGRLRGSIGEFNDGGLAPSSSSYQRWSLST